VGSIHVAGAADDRGDTGCLEQPCLGTVADRALAKPYGVVAAITPWNFPLSMASWKVGPALAAGNAIVLKPSELTPFSTVRLVELAVEASIPAGIFNVVQGTGAVTGDALSRHPGIAKFSFTGSTRTGVAVMKAAAESGIKLVTLELGGKSPQFVFPMPISKKAAGCIVGSLLANAGHACVAGSRIIVQRPVADALVAALRSRLMAVAPGPTWKTTTGFAPIISEAQARRIDGILERSRAQGAELLMGGGRIDGHGGAFYEPTLLANVDTETAAVREEVFGPVLTIQSFDSEEEGLALADHPELS
jgi:aldehyde dehydrogenase (NAD+)